MVETDCLEAVRMVNRTEDCFAEEGIFVEKIRSLLRLNCFHSFVYVPRTANRVAHEVARYVARLNGRFRWLGVEPD